MICLPHMMVMLCHDCNVGPEQGGCPRSFRYTHAPALCFTLALNQYTVSDHICHRSMPSAPAWGIEFNEKAELGQSLEDQMLYQSMQTKRVWTGRTCTYRDMSLELSFAES